MHITNTDITCASCQQENLRNTGGFLSRGDGISKENQSRGYNSLYLVSKREEKLTVEHESIEIEVRNRTA